MAGLGQKGTATAYHDRLYQPAGVEVVSPAPSGKPTLRGWLVVLGAFLNFSAGFGVINAFGTYQSYYSLRDVMSTTESGLVASLQLALLLAGGIIVGPTFDRFGARRLMVPGTVICLVAYLVCAFSNSVAGLIVAQGVLTGIRNAMLFHPAVTSISSWFDSHRALAIGTAVSGSSFGGIIWPLILDAVLGNPHLTSAGEALKWSFLCTLLISFAMMGASCWLVREKNAPVTREKGSGGAPAASPANSDLEARAARLRCEWADWFRCVRRVLSRDQLLLAAGLFFVFIGAMLPFTFIPLRAASMPDVDHSWPNYLLSICYASAIFGRVIPAWLGDRYGRFNVLVIMSLALGTVLTIWPQITTLPALILHSLLYGFASGAIIPLGAACVVQLCPDARHTGLCTGIVMAAASVGVLSAGPICGRLWEETRYRDGHAMEYLTAFATLFGTLFLAMVRFWARPQAFVKF